MARRNRAWVLVPFSIVLVAVLVGIAGCGQVNDGWQDQPRPKVVVSFPPLYSFARNVAGPDAQVQCLLVTEGPHDFKPTPQHAVKLRRADRFFINGLGLDDHIAKLKNDSANHHLLVVPAGSSVPQNRLRDLEACEDCEHDHGHAKHDHGHAHKHDHAKHDHAHHGHKHDHDHAHHGHEGHKHGKYDPHVWLGIPEAVQMVTFIAGELAAIDPAHAAAYHQRAGDYANRLREVQDKGRRELADKTERQLIAFHDSLYYFARTFDLKIVETVQTQPGSEPSPAHLTKLVELCKAKNVRLIAVEPQYPKSTAAETLLNELRRKGIPDAAFVVIDPMETAPSEAELKDLKDDFYIKKMEENIANLAKSLK